MSGQASASTPPTASDGLALVGSRTTRERDARGDGLELFDTSTVPWRHVAGLGCTNPSFLAPGRGRGEWYVVHGDGHQVSHVRASKEGVELLQTVDCGGENPVHLALVDDWLVVVNHSGSVVTLRVDPSGALGGVVGRLDLEGRPGPHATDQGRAKPHQVVPVGDGRLLVPDKGLDTVHVLVLDTDGGLRVAGGVRLRELSGPRHVAVHPQRQVAYTVDELSSTVTVLCLEPGQERALQVLTALPDWFVGDSRGAEVAVSPSGGHVVVSNRSGAGDRTPGGPEDDTIAVFPVLFDGRLGAPSWVGSGGIRPRFVTWCDQGRLVVANERSDTVMAVEPGAPQATPVLLARTGSPVCVVFQ